MKEVHLDTPAATVGVAPDRLASPWHRQESPHQPTATRAHLAVAATYGLVTAVFCLEFVRHPLSRTLMFGGDGYVTFWNYWWARQALVTLQANPLHTTYLTYPHDASLVFHSHDLLHGILTIPIQVLLPGMPGLTLSVNIISFLCFFLSALAMYWCTWTFTQHRFAAMVAGFGYAFSALHVIWRAMPVVGALYWLPLFTWLFVKVARGRGRVAALAPGICFGLCTFQSLYYTLFLAILTAFLSALVLWVETDRPRALRRVLVIDAWILVCALPMAAVVAHDLARTVYETPGATVGAPAGIDMDCRTSLDVAGLVIPGAQQGLWRWYAASWNGYLKRPTCRWPLFGLNGVGGEGAYVGIVPLLLAALAWRSRQRKVIIGWSVAAIGFLALALGPYLHIGGYIFRSAWLPLPYRLSLLGPAFFKTLYHEPWFFCVPALFSIWSVAAFGLQRLLAGSSRGQLMMARTLVVGWLVLDYAAPPFPAWPTRVPAVYSRIAEDHRPVAVYDVPTGEFVTLELYAFLQTAHGKPIARGYLARKNAAVMERDNMLQQASQSTNALDALLDELGPAYVVVHKPSLTQPSEREFAATLAQRLPKSYEDAEVAVYAWRLSQDHDLRAPQP